MRRTGVLVTGLLMLGLSASQASAGDLFTCQTIGSFNSCAGSTFWIEDNPDVGSVLNVSLTHWSSDLDLRLTGVGFYARSGGKNAADLQISPSFWDGTTPSGWAKDKNQHLTAPKLGGFVLVAASSVPIPSGYDFAMGGPLFSGEVFRFDIEGKIPPQVLWVWRAQNNDGSLSIDCFQAASGQAQCLSSSVTPAALAAFVASRQSVASAFVAAQSELDCVEGECLSTVPEPSTLFMLLTGLLGLGIGVRARRRAPGPIRPQ
jgi:hypothetical protein